MQILLMQILLIYTIMFVFFLPLSKGFICKRFSNRPEYMRLFSSSEKMYRLERIISNRGIGSRNECAKLLKSGRVSINGKVVRSGVTKYPKSIVVEIDGNSSYDIPLLAIYHKPTGIQSTLGEDRWGRENLAQLSLSFPFLKSMHPVGRLDADTSGLLLFSSDGHLTQTLLHPSTGIEREYEAIVCNSVDMDALGSKLLAGVETTDGTFAAKLLHVDELQETIFMKIPSPSNSTTSSNNHDHDLDLEGKEVNLVSKNKSKPVERKKEKEKEKEINNASEKETALLKTGAWSYEKKEGDGSVELPLSFIRLSVREGKYRMVRRILHNAGHSVIELHRVRYGNIFLDDLEEGQVRIVSLEEESWARTLTDRDR